MIIQTHDKTSVTIILADSDFSLHFAEFQSSFAARVGLSKIRFRVYPGKAVIDIARALRERGEYVQTGSSGVINTCGERVHKYCELTIELLKGRIWNSQTN